MDDPKQQIDQIDEDAQRQKEEVAEQEAQRIQEEADKQNLVLQIGYEFTFTPHIKEMRNMLENKNVSKIYMRGKYLIKVSSWDFKT